MTATIFLLVVLIAAAGFAYLSFNENIWTAFMTSIGFAVLAGVLLGRGM